MAMENSKCKKSRRRSMKMMALAVAVAQVAVMYPAGALVLKELSDAELDSMRGKFVSRGNVQYFGLSLSTSMVAPGFNHNVNMNVQMDLSGNDPKVSSSVSGSLGETTDQVVESRQNIEKTRQQVGGASESINGTVQNIQALGDDNRIYNKIALKVLNPNHNKAPAPEVNQTSGNQKVISVTQTPTTFNNNGVLTTVNDKGSLGYSVQVGDTLVVQQLGLNDANNTRQLLQSVQLQGNAHHIVNNIKLEVGFSSGRSMRNTALRVNDSMMGLM